MPTPTGAMHTWPGKESPREEDPGPSVSPSGPVWSLTIRISLKKDLYFKL